jgi:hypothetical protein
MTSKCNFGRSLMQVGGLHSAVDCIEDCMTWLKTVTGRALHPMQVPASVPDNGRICSPVRPPRGGQAACLLRPGLLVVFYWLTPLGARQSKYFVARPVGVVGQSTVRTTPPHPSGTRPVHHITGFERFGAFLAPVWLCRPHPLHPAKTVTPRRTAARYSEGGMSSPIPARPPTRNLARAHTRGWQRTRTRTRGGLGWSCPDLCQLN